MNLPPQLQPFQSAAKKVAVKEIEFSGPTYQVRVEDQGESHWVFLQFQGKGDLKDYFCSCEQELTDGGCAHLAAAYLSLFHSTDLPLHQRFAPSLWNRLCRVYEERLGEAPDVLKKLKAGYYHCLSKSDKVIFEISAHTPEATKNLDRIVKESMTETEENSIKFSNLLPEEIDLWKEGRPSAQLRYDLSYWSSFAKWMMRLQEEGASYTITFRTSSRELPNWIQIDFNELSAGFYLSEANLPLIIPALKTVDSPLKIFSADRKEISQITYDKRTGYLHIESKPSKESEKLPKKGKKIPLSSGWVYLLHEGFYTDDPHQLLQTPDLEGYDLSNALKDHARIISTYLQNCQINPEPLSLGYKLSFDSAWNLHISAFLFEPGDLSTGYNRIIGEWAYVEEDGFYPLDGKRFEEAETVIPKDQVADFITINRSWLNTVEGFHTHIRALEYQLSYKLTDKNRLSFTRTLTKNQGGPKSKDFGHWVYLEGFGFYSKAASHVQSLVKPGVSVSQEQIPLFISMNQEELSLIPGFFSSQCPVVSAHLKTELVHPGTLRITPEYDLRVDLQGKNVKIFDEYAYVDHDGFFLLPYPLRLPEPFTHPTQLEGEELDEFLTTSLETVIPFLNEVDRALIKPRELGLMTDLVAKAPKKGRGWYYFTLFYKTELGTIPLASIHEAIEKKQRYLFSKAGLLDLRNRQFDWVRRIGKDRFDAKRNTLLISTLEFMRLHALYTVTLESKDAASHELLDNLIQLKTPEVPDTGGMGGHLRPYQELGVNWLWFLYQHQLSGLLCDEMGLGKTHQAMALLTSINNLYRDYAEGHQHHFLIVCPTSVIYHWQDKLNHFLPHLRVLTFYGTNRNLGDFHANYDVLLTSYGILRNENEILSKIPFELAVFDEVQVAKNQFSRVYAALRKVQAQMRLGLTGTPIENYLRELKSLFDIVLPSYMPGETEYRDFFIKPIERERDPQRIELLNRMIKPFILRRKKADVLVDLPDKIEEVSYCDLSLEQSRLYNEVLIQRRRHLIEELKNEAMPISYMHIFALLTCLKQICNHPAVYLKKPSDFKEYASGKWDLFVELLSEARESGQKVVVFSQYLGMLDIMEEYLKAQGIKYASLRGATKHRKEQLQMFNTDPECEVFLGSLQAAGLGVDLTAGSVVIHYDRWWNAARENQATDRVHRIGQKLSVQVFKLVTKGTIEEKIDEMILRKGALMEDVISVDDQQLLKRFSRDELLELLEFSPTFEIHPNLSDTE